MFNGPRGHSYMAEYCCFICGEKSVLDISLAGGRASAAFLLSHHLECSMGLLTSFQQTCQVPLKWKVPHFSFFFFPFFLIVYLMRTETKYF